jgi:large subunit ribosomal protein L24
VAALSSWLAVRAIDRETRRLDSIERGEPPPATAQPVVESPAAVPQDQPASETPIPGRDPRRSQPKPKVSVPLPSAAPPGPNPPVVSQQVAPLPPPIEVRPVPGVVRQPKPRPPLVLTPPVASPAR